MDDGRSADAISDKDLIDRLKNNDSQFKHHLVRSTADQIMERAKYLDPSSTCSPEPNSISLPLDSLYRL